MIGLLRDVTFLDGSRAPPFSRATPTRPPAFLALPAPAAQIAGDSARKIILPEAIRASLQRRLRLRHFGDRLTTQR